MKASRFRIHLADACRSMALIASLLLLHATSFGATISETITPERLQKKDFPLTVQITTGKDEASVVLSFTQTGLLKDIKAVQLTVSDGSKTIMRVPIAMSAGSATMELPSQYIRSAVLTLHPYDASSGLGLFLGHIYRINLKDFLPKPLSLQDGLVLAREYLAHQKIDVSRHFASQGLDCVLPNQSRRCWLYLWHPNTASTGEIYHVAVYVDDKSAMHWTSKPSADEKRAIDKRPPPISFSEAISLTEQCMAEKKMDTGNVYLNSVRFVPSGSGPNRPFGDEPYWEVAYGFIQQPPSVPPHFFVSIRKKIKRAPTEG